MGGRSALANPLDDLPKDRLQALEDRLTRAKTEVGDAPHMKKDYAQANLAWRMVIELVAGLGIGFGVGYGLDRLFGTMPLFLVIFIFLGFAAGIKTMLNSAREIEKQQAAKAALDEEERRGD